jgi:mono/diheme cytochrome c family protein
MLAVVALQACVLSPEMFLPADDDAADVEPAVITSPGTAESKSAWYEVSLFDDVWKNFDVNLSPIPTAAEQKELYTRGAYLVRAAAACGSCHGAQPTDPDTPLSGGRRMRDRFGEVSAPNITPDVTTGIGAWSIEAISQAVRASIDKDDRPKSLELHQGYRWLSDRDTKAIAVYLLTQDPVRHEVERRELGDFERKDWGLFSRHRPVKGYVPELSQKATRQYGRYLAKHVSGCGRCHTATAGALSSATPFAGEEVAGGGVIDSLVSLALPDSGEADSGQIEAPGSVEDFAVARGPSSTSKPASDKSKLQEEPQSDSWLSVLQLSPREKVTFPQTGPDIRGSSEAGLSGWSDEDLVHYLESGETTDGKLVDPENCPWSFYEAMTLKDKQAIARFLKQI